MNKYYVILLNTNKPIEQINKDDLDRSFCLIYDRLPTQEEKKSFFKSLDNTSVGLYKNV